MGCNGSKKAKKPVKVAAAIVKVIDADGKEVPALDNEDIRDKYDLGKILGSGSFGQVREVSLKESPNGEVRAVKMIERDNEDGEWSNQAIFVREVGLLQQMKHDNIIRYYDFYEDVHFLYVVMELCKGGEVFAKIVELKRFSEKNAVGLGKQMLAAMDHIHGLNIAHRDIKAENFMLAEPCITGVVKMIDFGMATKFEPGQVLTELCGSPHYLAPELIGQKYNKQADVWAFGVLLYLLMYGHYPYDAKHPRDIMVKILTEPIRWQTKAKLSKSALAFLMKILEHDPKKRLTAAEALAHPWMSLASNHSEGELLSTEVLRSAHKKVTATRKTVDPKVDATRNKKLDAINEDFSKGIRTGKRLGETPTEDFMLKPEFLRRENKITTAPSANLVTRRGSLAKMMAGLNAVVGTASAGKKDQVQGIVPGSMGAIQESDDDVGARSVEAQAKDPGVVGAGGDDAGGVSSNQLGVGMVRSNTRAASFSGGSKSVPRRLSYIGALTNQEENNLRSLWEEKKRLKQAVGVVPEPGAGQQPGAPSIEPAAPQESEADDDDEKSEDAREKSEKDTSPQEILT